MKKVEGLGKILVLNKDNIIGNKCEDCKIMSFCLMCAMI